jgi:hypothetical protein
MTDDSPFVIYDDPRFRLVTLPPGADEQAFWESMTEAAAGADGTTRYTLSRRSSSALLRVVRTDFGTSTVLNFWIVSSAMADGSRIVRLQPLIGWGSGTGGLGTAVMTATAARAQVEAVIPDLQHFAAAASGT